MRFIFLLLLPSFMMGQDCKKDISSQSDKNTGVTTLSTPAGKQLSLVKEYSLKDTGYYFSVYVSSQEAPEISKGVYLIFEDQSKVEMADVMVTISVNPKGSGYILSSHLPVTKSTVLQFMQKRITSIRLANSTEKIKEKQSKKFMCWSSLIY